MIASTGCDKNSRIFIVDECHSNRLEIERSLNHLGYWRIAPLGSFRELCLLAARMLLPVDMLIVNRHVGEQDDVWRFCQRNPQIRHALIYEGIEPGSASPGRSRMKALQMFMNGNLSVEAGMEMIAQVNASARGVGGLASGSDQFVAPGEVRQRHQR
ncbi:hypothetical protein [Pseudomonas sp. MWU13-3659]|uniref:hypothetical protein n=1 Tax=Pseudomonas sp. MWU13-3659 TaxID=2986964 RepID=UPI002074D3A2|nr:hypothetical protein [Pseudomonas sp. MWU13-3659]